MPRGLRASDAVEIRRLLGGDMRLMLRVGALLEAQLAFTPLALERLAGDETGRKLLTDRRLGQVDASGFADIAAAVDDCTLVDADGWRVVALADELGNPLAEAPAAPPESGLPALVAGLSPSLRDPVEHLMQAREDGQRAAALERLRYAAPPLPVVGELMPLLLADGAELVRERAIGLIAAAGGSALIVDLVRAMQRRDDATLARLAPNAAHLPADQQEVALAAAAAQAARREASQGLVDLCAHLAPALARGRQLERILDLLLPAAFSLVDMVRALQAIDSSRVRSALRAALGFGAAQDARIIHLLAAPGEHGDDALLERGVDLLLEPGDEPRTRMALAAALRRLDSGRTLADRIARRGMRICQAHDTSVHWLLAELCRDGAVSPAAASELIDILRRLLREAPGPHLVSALEQQLAVLLPVDAAQRSGLVEPLIEVAARYRADRTHDLVVHALTGLGACALPGAWETLAEHPLEHVRLLAAGLIPDLLANAPDHERRAAAERLVAGMPRVVQGHERGALLAAAARLASTPPLDADPELAARIDTATHGLGRWAYPALGHLAAAAACDPARRRAILDQLLNHACAEIPDTPTQTQVDPATGETTFLLDERLGAHTEDVPAILAALGRIGRSGRSGQLAPDDLRRLVQRLIAQWKAVANWRVVWGPGNIHELARTLAALGEPATFPAPLRVQVVEALLPQIAQLAVARSLARILTLGDGGAYLSRLAGRAADQLVRLASGANYADDEREELGEALADFLAVPHLGADADAVRRRLVGVIASLRDHLSSRARARLRFLAGEMGGDLAARLDWA